jgi:hypothetical protein
MSSPVTQQFINDYAKMFPKNELDPTVPAMNELLKWYNQLPSQLTQLTGIELKPQPTTLTWAQLTMHCVIIFNTVTCIKQVIHKFNL